MLGAGGKSSALAPGRGAVVFKATCAASPNARSAKTTRGTAEIGRSVARTSEILAIQVEEPGRADQDQVDRRLPEHGNDGVAVPTPQQPGRLRHPVERRQ